MGVPMIEGVLGQLARTASTRRCSRSATSLIASSRPIRTGAAPGSRCATPSSPQPLDTAGAVRFAAEELADRRHLPGGQRRRAHRPRRDRPRGIPPRARRRGDHRPPPGRRPLPLRRRADRRGRPGHRLRREAAPRRGADQPDQRGHLRLRALLPRARPAGRAGLDRAGDLPRDGRATACSTPWPTSPTGSTPGPPRPTSRPIATSSRGEREPCLRAPPDRATAATSSRAQRSDPAATVVGERHRRWAAWSAAGGRSSTDSVLLPGARSWRTVPRVTRLDPRARARSSAPVPWLEATTVARGSAPSRGRLARPRRRDGSGPEMRCAGHRRRRLHRLDPRRPPPLRGSRGRRHRRPLLGSAWPTSPMPGLPAGLSFHQLDIRSAGRRRP